MLDDELKSADVEEANKPPEKATAGVTLELMKPCKPDNESTKVVGNLEARVVSVALESEVGTHGANPR